MSYLLVWQGPRGGAIYTGDKTAPHDRWTHTNIQGIVNTSHIAFDYHSNCETFWLHISFQGKHAPEQEVEFALDWER